MRILYLCQLIPYPLDAGPKVRAYYTLRYLAKLHEVTLLAFSRPDDRPEALEHLRSFCHAVHTIPMRRGKVRNASALLSAVLRGQSFIIRRDDLVTMRRKMDELLGSNPRALRPAQSKLLSPGKGRELEAVHADQLWMAQYALHATSIRCYRPILVLDEHNACFQIVQRLAEGEGNWLKRLVLRWEERALRQYEAGAIGQFDHVVTVTEQDRAALQQLALAERGEQIANRPTFHTIPICVDMDEMQPVKPRDGSKEVLHLGTMFFLPNVEGVLWFAREVWPRIRTAIPGAAFTIAGKNPPADVAALAGIDGIRVTGYVADPQSYLDEAGAIIVPLFAGSGMRVKILDAWRWGMPIISTTIGAEGIYYKDGENIMIADNAEDFTAAVLRVLSESGLNQTLRRNGRRWVEAHYDWQRVYPAWDAIYAG